MYRQVFSWPCIASLLVCALSGGEAQKPPNPETLLDLLRAREQSVVALDVTFHVLEGVPKDYQKYLDAQWNSTKAFGEAEGQPLPTHNPGSVSQFAPPQDYYIRFTKDDAGRMRIQQWPAEKNSKGIEHTYTMLYDGKRWLTSSSGRFSYHDGTDVPRADRFLALSFEWAESFANPPRYDSLYSLSSFLHEALDKKRLAVASAWSEKSQLAVTVRQALAKPPAPGRMVRFTFDLDANNGMSPVKCIYNYIDSISEKQAEELYEDWQKWCKFYHEGGQHYIDAFPLQGGEFRWTDFRDVGNGLSLPWSYSEVYYNSLIYPKKGSKINPFSVRLNPKEIDVSTFTVYTKKITVTKMEVNRKIDPKLFEIKIPPGTVVLDTTEKKHYVAGDEPSSVIPDPPVGHVRLRIVLTYLAVSVFIVLSAVFVWRALRHYSLKPPIPGGPA